MSEKDTDGGNYDIKVQGHLDEAWSDWFEGLQISNDEQGMTHLSGLVLDLAALHGILARLRDLGLPLVSLSRRGDSP